MLEANNGNSALLVGEQHKDIAIHILVTDMIMPGMGGRELAEQFVLKRPESRVVFMSGYTEDLKFEGGLARRETRFLQKPFSPGELAKAVREALDASLQLPEDGKEQQHQK